MNEEYIILRFVADLLKQCYIADISKENCP